MDIWLHCRDSLTIVHLDHELIRVVESQEQIATNSLVDDFEEQEILEQMLENTKPVIPSGMKLLHYLLMTPFRYPPLKHGSRFGTRFESSLFYGSHTLATAFAEAAYYRFLFWQGMSISPASGKFITQHTVFGVKYTTKMGLKLHQPPFSEFEQNLIDPEDYSSTQQLGSAMRQYSIEAFEFKSARDQEHGLNVALISQKSLSSKEPEHQQQWLCDTSASTVSFYSSVKGNVYKYPFNAFLVNGRFPAPAI